VAYFPMNNNQLSMT